MTLHYNTLHRYIHAPGTQIEVIWGSNYRYCWSFVPFYHHSKHMPRKISSQGFSPSSHHIPRFLSGTIFGQIPGFRGEDLHGEELPGLRGRAVPAVPSGRQARGHLLRWSLAFRGTSAELQGLPWGHGEKKHPWSPKTSRNRMGFRLNMFFFQVAVGAFFCGFLSEFCFFLFGNLYAGWGMVVPLHFGRLGLPETFWLAVLRRLLIKSSSHLVESQFWLPQSSTTVSSSKQTVGYPQSQILNVSWVNSGILLVAVYQYIPMLVG